MTECIAVSETNYCIGMHSNMPFLSPSPQLLENPTAFEQRARASIQHYWNWDSGYSKEQSTRPQTVGYGLVDSPTAQAAWIIEKFWSWADCDGHPENVFTRDELLDNVMMYWLTGAGASSARIYWESFSVLGTSPEPIHIPAGISVYPTEILRASRRWAEERFTNLVHYNALEAGGHFAAFEQPAVFVDEVRTCFSHMR